MSAYGNKNRRALLVQYGATDILLRAADADPDVVSGLGELAQPHVGAKPYVVLTVVH